MKEFLTLVFLTVTLTGCYLNEDVPEDQNIWDYSLPSQQGLADGELLTLDQEIEDDLFGATQSLIIIKNDQLIFENYYDENDRTTLFPIGRVGIGIVSALFGEVLNNELANQLDQPIAVFFPEYSEIFDETPAKRNITVRHLLNMTEGLAWNGSVISIEEESNDLRQMRASNDFVEYVLSRPLEAPPGNRFSFNSGNSIILLNLIDRLIDEPLSEFFSARLFGPLEITSFEVRNMPNGLPDYGTGLSLSTLDLTKIGYLLIKNGVWNGVQLIDSRWIDDMFSSQEEVDLNFDFGFQWWRFNDTSFIARQFGFSDFHFIHGERSQGLYLSRDGQFVITVNNGFNTARNFATPSFFIFIRILDSISLN